MNQGQPTSRKRTQQRGRDKYEDLEKERRKGYSHGRKIVGRHRKSLLANPYDGRRKQPKKSKSFRVISIYIQGPCIGTASLRRFCLIAGGVAGATTDTAAAIGVVATIVSDESEESRSGLALFEIKVERTAIGAIGFLVCNIGSKLLVSFSGRTTDGEGGSMAATVATRAAEAPAPVEDGAKPWANAAMTSLRLFSSPKAVNNHAGVNLDKKDSSLE